MILRVKCCAKCGSPKVRGTSDDPARSREHHSHCSKGMVFILQTRCNFGMPAPELYTWGWHIEGPPASVTSIQPAWTPSGRNFRARPPSMQADRDATLHAAQVACSDTCFDNGILAGGPVQVTNLRKQAEIS
eukprot:CAMPEP_0170392720 /NCGR_PEP_ID=MMETSP0117_2-20130122/20342_1 /TAXON_ID=400756 /ORGANISM="Durinskia baltica, Strain CSIRO CS-38" /LENGTH=131 /DNA_ID=CAMNT_0010648875 /DNA_START=159 /DNA_END=555 /DNA_ORIENTATION=-